MSLRASPSRTFLATAAMALWMVATSMSPAMAISNGSSIRLQNDPPPLVGLDLAFGASNGDPIRAALFNGSGKAARIEGIPIRLQIEGMGRNECIEGDEATTNANGVATFTPRVTCLGFGYRLQAHADDGASLNSGNIATSAPSAAFDVIPATACGATCVDTDEQGDTSARVSAEDGDRVLLAVGGPSVNCADYAEESQSVTFLVTEASGLSTVRVTLQDPDQGAANKYQVCFSSPDSSFVSRSGQNVAKGDAGLLKDCADVNPANKPCVVDRFKENGAVVVIITVPPGDPRIKL